MLWDRGAALLLCGIRCARLKRDVIRKMQLHNDAFGVSNSIESKGALSLSIKPDQHFIFLNLRLTNPSSGCYVDPRLSYLPFDHRRDSGRGGYATFDGHAEGLIFSRCPLMPRPKVFHLARWRTSAKSGLELVMSLWESFLSFFFSLPPKERSHSLWSHINPSPRSREWDHFLSAANLDFLKFSAGGKRGR